MKSNSFNLWLILSISSAIRALCYHLSSGKESENVNKKTYTAFRKPKDKRKSITNIAKEVEDRDKCIMYTLSENARR